MMFELIAYSALVVWAYMSLWSIYAIVKKRNDIADVAWGLGFIVVALACLAKTENLQPKAYITAFLVILWGGRLAVHIAARHQKGPEDKRYQKMREKWHFPRLQAYLDVFMLQGVFMLLVSAPIYVIMNDTTAELAWYNWLGIAIWVVGFFFESVSDYQLSQFIADKSNKSKIMKTGLWKFSRHPNYFGEITQWWGIFAIALFSPYWLFAVVGPLTITILILGISGIPMLEKRYEGNKEYEKYQKTTSGFFPLPAKSD